MEELSSFVFANFVQLFLKFIAERETSEASHQLLRAQSFLSFYERKGE